MADEKLFTIIFVDDEAIVREGISTRIPWGKNGFALLGTFNDGVAAMDFLADNTVDVVLSDISMPRMDGLALSREIAEKHPRTQVLLLTGFEEFEYAQEAVRHRVKEFLLKPITAEELSAVLERTKTELRRIREGEKDQERLKALLDRSLPLLKERFFYRLVSGRINREDAERRRDFFGWKDLGCFYIVVVASLPDEWEELTRLSLAESARDFVEDNGEVFGNRNEDLVVLLQGRSEMELTRRAAEIAEKLFTAAIELHESSITVGIGEFSTRLEDLNLSYIGACNAVDHAKILGLSRVQSIDQVRRKSRVSQEAFSSREGRLLAALREGSSTAVRSALDAVFELFEKSYMTSSDATTFLARLQFHLRDFIDEMGLAEKEEFQNLALTRELEVFPRLDQAKVFFTEQIRRIEEFNRRRRNDALHSRIDKAQAIIAREYSRKDFALQDICAELYLSTSQFSALFKDGTGRTFVEYLTEVRIDEARKLLKTTDMRSYEIADKVGYQDPRYFSSIFKKITGLTTSEYRRGLEE